MGEDMESSRRELDRRTLMRRAAVLAAATAWVTPTVQSVASPAFATGSPRECHACLSCSTTIWGGTLNGRRCQRVELRIPRICCDATDGEIQVTAYPEYGSPMSMSCRDNLTVVCRTQGPGPDGCPDQFQISATKTIWGKTYTASLVFHDDGNPNTTNTVRLTVIGPHVDLSVDGVWTGNIECDC